MHGPKLILLLIPGQGSTQSVNNDYSSYATKKRLQTYDFLKQIWV